MTAGGPGMRFLLVLLMLRELLHTDQLKSIAEEIFNCWLSYTTSQPVQFDLAILLCFLLQYVGFSHLVNRARGLDDVLG